jgi:serine/threonine-protein kinase PknK
MSEPETREGVVPPPRYELAACLGRGGGGEVWAVRDRSTLRTVALKVLRAGAAESEVLALVREATALSGLEGLGVPRVLRFGRLGDGRPYLVRELVAGVSLAELVGQPEASPTALLTAVAEVADQLTLLHRALLLHGDVKPANVIVSEQGPATLVDLGLSAALREGGARALGLTPRYAAPELLAGGPLTVRAEVYSLGATLRDVLEACAARLDDATRGAIGEVVTRALARAAEQRFPSADELASALRLAASLPEPAARGGSLGQTWPIVELDERAAALGRRIEALDDGRGLVLLGPRGSGRSTLLRRMAWGLGARGAKIAWLSAEEIPTQPPSTEAPARGEGERKPTSPPLEALRLELAAYPSPRGVTLLVDDAAHLAPDVALAVEEAAAAGARLVLVVDPDGQMPVRTSTLDVVTQAPLEHARELVRRVAPSLPEAVVSHVLARSGSLPGPLRALLTKLEGRAVVSPDDVDALASPPPRRRGRRARAARSRSLRRGRRGARRAARRRHPLARHRALAAVHQPRRAGARAARALGRRARGRERSRPARARALAPARRPRPPAQGRLCQGRRARLGRAQLARARRAATAQRPRAARRARARRAHGA